MTEPDIRYAHTDGGISIAYWTVGSGFPLLIWPPFHFGHIQLELEDPEVRPWFERLAGQRMVVRFDPLGQGLSQRHLTKEEWRHVGPYTARDALVRELAIEQYDSLGCGQAGFVACEDAAQNPAQVRRLILWAVPPDGRDWGSTGVVAAYAAAELDWRTFTETYAHAVLGWSQQERAARWARFMRRAMDGEDFMAAIENGRDSPKAADVLARIVSPTLVVYPSAGRTMTTERAQKLTASIKGSKLVLIPVAPGMMVPSNDEGLRAIESFLDEGLPSAPMAGHTGTAIILFADIVDSTALTERMGDAAFRAKARDLDTSLRAIIAEAGGTTIDAKTLGDGVLATFPAASQAIDAALRCEGAAKATQLQLHLGLHAGDVIREEGNVFGGAVNIASRISALSAPGEVLVSDIVRGLARTSAGVVFEDRGEHTLKGIADPVRVYAVRRAVEESPLAESP